MNDQPGALATLDWRRRVTDLYRAVRQTGSPTAAHQLWRNGRDELIGSHPASPLPASQRGSFSRGRYGDYDPSLRFELDVDVDVAPAEYSTMTGTDGLVRFSRIGRVTLGALGSLDVWWHEGYAGGVFLPLWDPHPSTYAGGRYLIDTAKGADLGGELDPGSGRGVLVVDLNFSYNPSCAYDPAWACPLAPPTNRLVAPLGVGELTGAAVEPTGAASGRGDDAARQ